MYHYNTVTEALQDLKSSGFRYDFNLLQDELICKELQRAYKVPQLKVLETYRFEGASDPADEAIVLAIAADDGVHGTFVNGYGTYADSEQEALLHLLKRLSPAHAPIQHQEERYGIDAGWIRALFFSMLYNKKDGYFHSYIRNKKESLL